MGQQAAHEAVHQRRALGRQQVAQNQHDGGVQQQRAQTAGDKGCKLFCLLPAPRFAAEHERPVGGVGKQDAEDVIQHIAPAVGGGIAEQPVEQRVQQDIEQGGQHPKDQVAEHFPMFLEPLYHKVFPFLSTGLPSPSSLTRCHLSQSERLWQSVKSIENAMRL